MKHLSAALLCGVLASNAAAAAKHSKPDHVEPATPAAPLHPPVVSSVPVTFVWPPEGMVLSAENEFVFGAVSDPKAHFEINGATVAVHKDGGFIAWLPISAGTFTFRASLSLPSGTTTAQRTIFVPPAAVPLPDDKLAIDQASLLPKADLVLKPGDYWTARMKASRGKPARVRAGGGPWKAMREVNPKLGLYEAIVPVEPGEKLDGVQLEYEIGSGWSSHRAKGAAKLTAPAPFPLVATVKSSTAGFANIKTEPGQGFMLFPPPGTRLLTTGRDGDSVRVELSPSFAGWIDARDVDLNPDAAPPHAETGNVGVIETAAGASVRFGLSERVPFEVVEHDALDGLTVRVFGAVGHTNLVTFDGAQEFVETVRWRQEATGVVAFTIVLKPGKKVWGWNARYDGGSSLRLDVRRPPRVNPRRPLEGWRVMLDPGHMPSAHGATGPLGTTEMDANYAIAQAAAERLLREGAVPLLTRDTTAAEVSLVDRPKQAVERAADVFVSLHNNALPDGSNPFAKPRGFTVFYYHQHSLALGRALHAAYAASAPVPDEGLQWDNLLVARLSAVPAVLIENAFIILPEQEAMLNDPAFRAKLAASVVDGLRTFALENGERKR